MVSNMIDLISTRCVLNEDGASIYVVYQVQKTAELFTVEWNNVCESTGELIGFSLSNCTEATSFSLREMINDLINEGETDENKDLDLYLEVRDTFDRIDCESRFESEIITKDFDVSFLDEVEESFTVNVQYKGKVYSVVCQFETDDSYRLTNNLSCANESGSDLYTSGLIEAISPTFFEEQNDELYNSLVEKIERCANEQKFQII